MIIFEGYEKWFKTYTVSHRGKYVVFLSKGKTIDLNTIEDVEDEFDITFVSCMSNSCAMFRINYE